MPEFTPLFTHLSPPRHVHFIGVCGRGMSGVAAALAESVPSIRVTGSDETTYGNVSQWLTDRGIVLMDEYRPENLDPAPDLVVIGRWAHRGNPEVEAVLNRRIPYLSMPEFLSHWILPGKRNLVVAGTKGKTTTTAMTAWILECAGKRPGYFIGGFPENLPSPSRFTDSEIMILEGDDYSTLWWNDNPKFCYYRPETAIITNIYPDHPELHTSEDSTRRHYQCLVDQIPENGLLILGDAERSPLLPALAEQARCPVRTITFDDDGPDSISEFSQGEQGIRFRWHDQPFELTRMGRMNARNAVAATMAAEFHGVSPAEAAEALRTFTGVEGRQDPIANRRDIALYCDLAYLPPCMDDMIEALRARHPGRRLVFLWQPFIIDGLPESHDALRTAMAACDHLLFCEPYRRSVFFKESPMEFLTTLAADLRGQGKAVDLVGPVEDLPRSLPALLRPHDVVFTVLHPRHWSVLDELAENLQDEPR